MRRPSIRLRVTVVVASVVAVALGSMAYALAEYSVSQQIDQLDEDLEIDARVVAQLIGRSDADTDAPRLTDTGRTVQLVDGRGTLVDTRNAGQVPLLPPGERVVAGNRTREVDGTGPFRLRVRALPGTTDRFLVIGRSVAEITRADRSLRQVLVLVVPGLTIAFSAVAWIVVGRALRPVEQIRSEVGDFSEHDLAQRIEPPGTGDEVDRLADTMNVMLGRLERASQRERQFVADASHELRSPVAAARALMETRPHDPVAGAVHDTESIAALVRLQHLMEQLLELARHDLSEPTMDRPVDLDDLVLLQARQLRWAHPDLTVDTSTVSAAQVRGSAEALGRMVENLATNAARHARSTVRFQLDEQAGTVVLSVSDDGEGISPEDRTWVFERFTQLDESREGAGAGLGLAIVARIVDRHGGTVAVEDPSPGVSGAVFTVRLRTT